MPVTNWNVIVWYKKPQSFTAAEVWWQSCEKYSYIELENSVIIVI